MPPPRRKREEAEGRVWWVTVPPYVTETGEGMLPASRLRRVAIYGGKPRMGCVVS